MSTQGQSASDKKAVKETYKNSRDHIRLIMNLFGHVQANDPFELHNDRDFDAISKILDTIVNSQKIEQDNDYKNAIQSVGTWLVGAYQKDYLLSHKEHSPNIMYLVKKGLDVLHTLLHRDFRRRQMSSTESQTYYSFEQAVSHLSDARDNAALSKANAASSRY